MRPRIAKDALSRVKAHDEWPMPKEGIHFHAASALDNESNGMFMAKSPNGPKGRAQMRSSSVARRNAASSCRWPSDAPLTGMG